MIENSQDFYKNNAIGLLASVDPNNELDDNDSRLNEQMQAVFDIYFLDYKARVAGKSFEERVFDGCSFTSPDSKHLLSGCIKEMRVKLTAFPGSSIPVKYAFKIRRMLDFLNSMEKSLENELNKSGMEETIIKSEYIGLIYDRYAAKWFPGESKQQWASRFIYPTDKPIEPIYLSNKEAREKTDKLALIAILATIQETTGNKFNFQKFAEQRFGLKNFDKAKKDHKDKATYIEIYKECSTILKK